MSTNFPVEIDILQNPTPTDYLNSPSHSGQHANVNDAIEAIQAKLGIDSSAVTTSHDYKLSDVTGTDKAVGKTATQTITNKTFDNTSPSAFNPAGEIKAWPMKTAPTGHLLCDGSAVSRSTYDALFAAIVPTIGTFTVTIASPAVVTLNGHGFIQGDAVYLITTGALPTGLSANTLYYVIYINANTFRLATSRVNAKAGTAINTSGTQSGVHTLNFCPFGLGNGSTTFNVPNLKGKVIAGSDSSQTEFDDLGIEGGAKTHTLAESEMPNHGHGPGNVYNNSRAIGSGGVTLNLLSLTATEVNQNINLGNKGSGAAHNNLQPFIVMNYIIKT